MLRKLLQTERAKVQEKPKRKITIVYSNTPFPLPKL